MSLAFAHSSVASFDDTARAAVRWSLGHAVPRYAMRFGARTGDLQARAFMAATRSQDLPVELFRRIRESGDFYQGRFSYVTARMNVVKEVLASPDVHAGDDVLSFKSWNRIYSWAQATAPIWLVSPPSLLGTEPPGHTRMRRLVTRVFSAKAVAALQKRTEQIADDLLDDLPVDRPVDLVEAYCDKLPVTVISEILGVPTEERNTVLNFGSRAAPSIDLGLSWRMFRETESALREFETWLDSHIQRKRARPGDDLLSQLVSVRDDGEKLSDPELKSTAALVLGAGFETTVNLISNGVALLAENPEQRRSAVQNPERWGNVVEEVLRFDPPVLMTGRTVTRETKIAGTVLPPGTMVTTLLAGANRDPEVVTDPEHFDISRYDADEHVSFSSGRHYCLGAALARMEGRIALQKLHERFPKLGVVEGATRRNTRILRGYKTLPVMLDR